MRWMFVILALTGVLLQSTGKLAILIRFRMNQEFIAKNLCVQKNVENNCCKGKCHLTKELKETDKKEQGAGPSVLKDKSESNWFFQPLASFDFQRSYLQLNNTSPYLETALVSYSGSVFRPPCLA